MPTDKSGSASPKRDRLVEYTYPRLAGRLETQSMIDVLFDNTYRKAGIYLRLSSFLGKGEKP